MKNILLAAGTLTLAITSINSWADDRDDWPNSMTLGTASQGGAYYVYGSGWANLVNETLDTRIGSEITAGPVQNATFVQTGEHEFGMVTMGPAMDALEGNSPLMPGVEHSSIRAMFPMYQTTFHVMALERSGIETFADLEGKRVGIGPAGGTSDTYYPEIFEHLNYDVELLHGGASDQASQLQDGLIDAFAFAVGLPTAAFSQAEAQVDINIFSNSEEEIETILELYPELARAIIPEGIYNSVESDIPSVALWNFAITHEDMPESLVYEIVKTIMENNDRMMQIHRASAETIPENVDKNNVILYHPGAVRWFEENGYEIPEDLKG